MGADSAVVAGLAGKFAEILPHLDERQRRLYLGSEARALGGGLAAAVAVVAEAAGVSRATVMAGAAALAGGAAPVPGRARRPGAGRRRLEVKDPGLAAALTELLEASTRGDPCSPLRWTTLSLAGIAGELARRGHRCGKDAVRRMLAGDGYSLRGNSRTIEGKQHPDRDAQFRYINDQAKAFLAAGDPVISVDAKKKEQVGPYGRPGRTWRPKGDPVRVRDHDFPDKTLGKVTPYGVYDVAANTGFVNVGTDRGTAAFAVESIRRWWHALGEAAYAGQRRLLVTCDAGGANDWRSWTWKAELAELARQTGLAITVCHFPPGTSKWNKIEHRLFSAITRNWRGRPLVSHEVIISTIAAVTTATGLTVQAMLDAGKYPGRVKISGKRIKDLEDRVLDRHAFHGEWNYTLRPAPAAPAPAPPPPRPDLAALAALAGVPDFSALLAAVAVAWQARREQRLHLARGGARRKHSGCGPRTLPFEAIVAAAACHLRLGMTYYLLSQLLGAHDSTISLAAGRITPLLAEHGITPQAGGTRISTLDQLREHAAAHGITITGITSQVPRQGAYQDDTPKTVN
jgi:hypothetical protein